METWVVVTIWFICNCVILIWLWDGIFCGDSKWQRSYFITIFGSWVLFVVVVLTLHIFPIIQYLILLLRDWGW